MLPPLHPIRILTILCWGMGYVPALFAQSLQSIRPPEAEYQHTTMEIHDEKYVSTLSVRAKLPISELEKQLNRKLTGLLYEDGSYEDDDQDNLKAKVWKLGDIRVQGRDNLFLFDVPLKIWASAGYKVSPFGFTMSGYKDTEFSLRVRLISEVAFSPDWQLITQTRVDSYDWITEPSVSVAGIAIPVKSMVSRMLNRNAAKITKAIDQEVKKNFDVKKQVEEIWAMAQKPVLLSGEYHTWLVNTPQEVMAMLPAADARNLNLTIGIRGYTQTIVSAPTPSRTLVVKLPPLKTVDKIPHPFQIGLISSISYSEAADMAQAYFKGKKFSFSNNKYAIQVTSIDLFGQNDKLVIKAGLSGSLKGFIYLKGTPHYDAGTKLLTLRDVEYDIDTRNVLVKAASWLLHGRLARMMTEALVFPVGEQLDALTSTLRQTLVNHPVADGIFLHGKLNEAAPDKVYLTPEYIYTIVNATGEVTLEIRKLDY